MKTQTGRIILVLATSLLHFISFSSYADGLPGTLQVPLTLRDHKFVPPTIEIPANTKIELLVTNEGPGREEFESSELNREKIIPAKIGSDDKDYKPTKILIGPFTAGQKYKFFGDYHQDTAQGLIIVK